jgi:putative spermidine/putrescine transport system permease protein
MPIWETIEAFSDPYTAGYFLAAVDLQLTPDGIEAQPEEQRIYILLFQRTMFMSLVITISCVLLGYPIAYLLSNLPMRTSNLLLILVLLPFWTSLLVRTSAWKVLLQQQGVINDILVWIGLWPTTPAGADQQPDRHDHRDDAYPAALHDPAALFGDEDDPALLRARRQIAGRHELDGVLAGLFPAIGAGIGAGCILVFILAIGYYITPELVGGTHGHLHLQPDRLPHLDSLNWGLAAALGSILLALVLVLYWLYDRIVGIDNVKLG